MTDAELVPWLQTIATEREATEPIAMVLANDAPIPLSEVRSERQLVAELKKLAAAADDDGKRTLGFRLLERAIRFDNAYGSGSITSDYSECGELFDAIARRVERRQPIPPTLVTAVDAMIDQVNEEERVFYSAPFGLAILSYAFAVNLEREPGAVLDRISRDVKSYFADWVRDHASIGVAHEDAVASLLYRRELQTVLDQKPRSIETKAKSKRKRTRN